MNAPHCIAVGTPPANLAPPDPSIEDLFAEDDAEDEAVADDDIPPSGPWLVDLAREVQAMISVARRRRELGLGHAASDIVFLSLPETAIAALAAGGRVRAGRGSQRREWSLATLACGAELPLAQWRQLHATCRRLRRARSLATDATPQTRAYLAIEDQLPPRLAAILGVLAVLATSERLYPLLKRCDWGGFGRRLHTPSALLRATRIADQPETMDEEAWFGRHGILITQDICEVPTDGDSHLRYTPLYLSRTFLDRCLGIAGSDPTPGPIGVLSSPPERLEDVVLTQTQRRQAETVLQAVPWVSGTGHALGILLHGPSGTGKTLLARALAGSSGRPLLLVTPADEHPKHNLSAAELEAVLERSAREHLVLLIDEAEGLLNPELSRCLLTALERHPAALILATNQPGQLAKALDRRLQIKIAMDSPGPVERSLLLRRELRVQAPRLEPGLLEDPELDRLAESSCLPGGYWRTVVEDVARRGRTSAPAGTPAAVTLDHLATAVMTMTQMQIASFGLETSTLSWDRGDPVPDDAIGPERGVELDACAAALAGLRHQRAVQGDPGIGCVVAVTGAEVALARAAARRMARTLHLPLACLGIHGLVTDGGAAGKDADSETVEELTPAAQQVLSALGEQTVLLITLHNRRQWRAARPLITRLGASRHLGVVHLVASDLFTNARDLCSVVRPWAQPDAWDCNRLWRSLGGVGLAPRLPSYAALRTAAFRQRLGVLGLTGGGLASLP